MIVGLVSLFNGISTFVVYLMRKPSLLKNSNKVSFLMAYQSLWVILCQRHLCKRTAVILLKVSLFNGI